MLTRCVVWHQLWAKCKVRWVLSCSRAFSKSAKWRQSWYSNALSKAGSSICCRVGWIIYIYYICYNTRKICTGQVRWVVAAICGPTPKRGNHGAWLLIHKGGFGGFTVCRYRKSSPNSCGIERGSQVQGCSRSCIPGVSIQAIGCLQNESVFWACQFYAWFYVILMSWHVILIMRHFLSL